MNLPNDVKARARFIALVVALGMEAETLDPQHAATLARLAAWSPDLDIDTLATLIRRARGRSAARHLGLVREVAELLDHPHPMSTSEWFVIGLPAGLARRIRSAASEWDQR